jgi:hypothetical protein
MLKKIKLTNLDGWSAVDILVECQGAKNMVQILCLSLDTP